MSLKEQQCQENRSHQKNGYFSCSAIEAQRQPDKSTIHGFSKCFQKSMTMMVKIFLLTRNKLLHYFQQSFIISSVVVFYYASFFEYLPNEPSVNKIEQEMNILR